MKDPCGSSRSTRTKPGFTSSARSNSLTDLLELKHVDGPPAELGDYARLLLSDRELAGRLGSAARRKAAERFSSGRFVRGLTRAIDAAREHWQALKRGN